MRRRRRMRWWWWWWWWWCDCGQWIGFRDKYKSWTTARTCWPSSTLILTNNTQCV